MLLRSPFVFRNVSGAERITKPQTLKSQLQTSILEIKALNALDISSMTAASEGWNMTSSRLQDSSTSLFGLMPVASGTLSSMGLRVSGRAM